MMIRSCVVAMVIASTAATAHLCGAPTTTGTVVVPPERVAQEVESAVERHREKVEQQRRRAERRRETTEQQQELIERQRERIGRMVDEHRRLRLEEGMQGSIPPEETREEETGPGTDLVAVGDDHYVVRVAAGLRASEVERLRAQLAQDVPADFIQVEKAGEERSNVVIGRLRTRARAVSVYRTLVERGYRFETLPGWGSVIEKREGEGKAQAEAGEAAAAPAARPPAHPAVSAARQQPLPAHGGTMLPEFFTSATVAARAERRTPPTLDEYLRQATGGAGSVNLAFSGAPVERVLDSITRQTGITAVARGRTSGRPVSVLLRDAPAGEALRQVLLALAAGGGLIYAPAESPGTLEFWDQASFKAEVLPRFAERRVFDVRQIALNDAWRAVQPLLTPDLGTAVQIPSNNKLVVSDLPWVLREVEDLLAQIDRKAGAPAPPPGRETEY